MTFHRVAGAARHLWASVPLIGFVALFAGIGYGVFQSYHARQLAATAAQFGKDNKKLIEQIQTQDAATIKAKDDIIADKDRQITAKDASIASLTLVVGQVYTAAVALQQQVTALGGQPKTIPVTLPRTTTLSPPPSSPAPAVPPRPPGASTVAPTPSMSPAINLQVPCLPICPPKRG